MLELEPLANEAWEAGRVLDRLAMATSLERLLEAVAAEVRGLTGFDRVMVYRFDEDGHGQVIAEARDEAMEPYLGLHYPESDIPRQARELYLRNWIRTIPDARYTPVALLAGDADAPPLDLSLAHLRSVSPVHLEYLANMGLDASMSVSLIVAGRLWGLISCGHRAAKAMPYPMRRACETIGRIVSLQIDAFESVALQRQLASQQDNLRRLSAAMHGGQPHVLHGLLGEPQGLLGIAQASGAAVLVKEEVHCVGDTPDGDSVTRLAERFAADPAIAAGDIVATRQLGVEEPAWAGLAGVASGVLAFRMPEPVQGWVFWFRPELVQTVHWGGNPDKQASIKLDESGVPRLHPRRSFAAWQEQLRGRSLPWGDAERRLAADLRRSAIELDLARQVHKEREAVRARDDLVAVVSHDLRTPMGVISMQAVLIQRLMQQSLGQMSPRLLSSARMIQRAADRMAVLLQDLLDLAKIEAGRFDVSATAQPLAEMLQDAFELLLPMAQHQRVDLHIDAVPAVNVQADPERIFQVVSNLVSNAIKFTPAGGKVALRARVEGSHAIIEVQDTGAGIAPQQLPRIFDRYWQARHASTAGTGLGLYIAKGIVQAHGGTITAASEVGQGTTMSFTLPLAA